jgi:Peptidase_C39 like family/Peptidase C39 family
MVDLLPFEIHPQPDDTTCGPTCLYAVYRYYGREVPLARLLREVPSLEQGGTLGVHLANHALELGYRVRIVTWNLQIFDPSWFGPGAHPIRDCLLEQMDAKPDAKLRDASLAYVRFLDRGGRLAYEDLKPSLLRETLKKGRPIITGLSSTFLYRTRRERPADQKEDDIRGEPVGHFVVLTGYDSEQREVQISDPLQNNPLSRSHSYRVKIDRLIGAIFLGALTHDANLIIVSPPKGPA